MSDCLANMPTFYCDKAGLGGSNDYSSWSHYAAKQSGVKGFNSS